MSTPNRNEFKTRKEYRWAVKDAAHATGAPLGTRRLWAMTGRRVEQIKAPVEPSAMRDRIEASTQRMDAFTARRQARTAELRARTQEIRQARVESRASDKLNAGD